MSTSIEAYRHTARLLVMDEQKHVLMIKIEDNSVHDPNQPRRSAFWVTPGGKVEEGESSEKAALRELFEETGIRNPIEFGPCIWKGSVVLNWKGVVTQLIEKFYLARVQREKISTEHLTNEERAVIKEHRWFSIEELRCSKEIFIPKDLPMLVDELARGVIQPEKDIDLSTPKM